MAVEQLAKELSESRGDFDAAVWSHRGGTVRNTEEMVAVADTLDDAAATVPNEPTAVLFSPALEVMRGGSACEWRDLRARMGQAGAARHGHHADRDAVARRQGAPRARR